MTWLDWTRLASAILTAALAVILLWLAYRGARQTRDVLTVMENQQGIAARLAALEAAVEGDDVQTITLNHEDSLSVYNHTGVVARVNVAGKAQGQSIRFEVDAEPTPVSEAYTAATRRIIEEAIVAQERTLVLPSDPVIIPEAGRYLVGINPETGHVFARLVDTVVTKPA